MINNDFNKKGGMNVERIQAKDVASLLNFSVTNLKNYANLLEQHGYQIHRNVKNHREYSQEDIKVLQAMIYLNKEKSMLLEDAASFVTSSDTDINEILSQQKNANIPALSQDNDSAIGVLSVLSTLLQEQRQLREEMIQRDNERLEELKKVNEKMNEQAMLMQSLQAEIAKHNASQDEKKGFWAKLFG